MKAWIAVLVLVLAGAQVEASTYRERGLRLVDSAEGKGGCQDETVMFFEAKTEKGEILKKLDKALAIEQNIRSRVATQDRIRRQIAALPAAKKVKTVKVLGLKIAYMGVDEEAEAKYQATRAKAEDEFAISIQLQQMEIEEILAEVDATLQKTGMAKRETRDVAAFHKHLIESGAVVAGIDYRAHEVVYEQHLACKSVSNVPLLY